MTNFQGLISLYMRVNNISRNQLAEMIKIPPSAARRLIEGKQVKSDELLLAICWLFAGDIGPPPL